MPTYVEIGLLFSISLIGISLYLVARHRISVRFFSAWFVVGIGLGFVFGTPTFFSALQNFLGTDFLLSGAVFVAFVGGLSLIFYQQWKLSDSDTRIRTLAGEIALLKYRLDKSDDDNRKIRS